ncbi:MAG: hypothetical protein CYPHOPRED_003681, partial [Cyphobasidiales sp. Tagirdzhanova-0007]
QSETREDRIAKMESAKKKERVRTMLGEQQDRHGQAATPPPPSVKAEPTQANMKYPDTDTSDTSMEPAHALQAQLFPELPVSITQSIAQSATQLPFSTNETASSGEEEDEHEQDIEADADTVSKGKDKDNDNDKENIEKERALPARTVKKDRGRLGLLKVLTSILEGRV